VVSGESCMARPSWQHLEAVQQIKDVKIAYWCAADRGDLVQVEDCLAADRLVIDFQGMPHCASREEFMALMRSYPRPAAFKHKHIGHNPRIVVLDSMNAAEGVWDATYTGVDLEGRTITEVLSEYHDTYVRSDGRWKIQSMMTRRAFIIVRQIAEDGSIRVTSLSE
jgi:hypothetical protein